MCDDHICLPPRLSPGLVAHEMVDESLLGCSPSGTSWPWTIRDNVAEEEATLSRKAWLEAPFPAGFSLPTALPCHTGLPQMPRGQGALSPLGILPCLEPPDLT